MVSNPESSVIVAKDAAIVFKTKEEIGNCKKRYGIYIRVRSKHTVKSLRNFATVPNG